jgi:hypothetical protein
MYCKLTHGKYRCRAIPLSCLLVSGDLHSGHRTSDLMGNHWKRQLAVVDQGIIQIADWLCRCGERQRVKDEQAKGKTIRKIYRLTSISQYEVFGHRPVPPSLLQMLLCSTRVEDETHQLLPGCSFYLQSIKRSLSSPWTIRVRLVLNK